MFHVPNKYRIITGIMKSDNSFGNNGYFAIKKDNTIFHIIASDGANWEHVSVHIVNNDTQHTPSWDEMCFVKNLFWDETDCVIQYHPAKSEYVNRHEHVLHLWRPINQTFPTPPKILVG